MSVQTLVSQLANYSIWLPSRVQDTILIHREPATQIYGKPLQCLIRYYHPKQKCEVVACLNEKEDNGLQGCY